MGLFVIIYCYILYDQFTLKEKKQHDEAFSNVFGTALFRPDEYGGVSFSR